MKRLGPMRVGLAVLLLGGNACRPDAPATTPDDPSLAGEPEVGADDDDAEGSARNISLTRAGAAHSANIDLVAIASDGTAVVSRDQIGGVRLWPDLAGNLEPIAIPERGAQALSVQPAEDGHTVALVDAAAGGKIFAVSAAGAVELVGELPPFEPLFQLAVLPGGRHIAALYKDHTLRLVSTEGKRLTTFGERRFRPQSLAVSADGKMIVAIIKDKSGNSAEVQRLRVSTGDKGPSIARLGSPTVVDAGVPLSPTTLVVSPDAKRIAWVDRAAGSGWEIKHARLTDDEAPQAFNIQSPTHLTPNLGFSAPGRLLVSSNDGTLSWLRDLDAESTHPRAAAPQDFVNQGRAQALGGGVQVSGFGTWLFVHEVAMRTHRFVGYRSLQTQAVALSPKGSHIAWAYASGALFVEAIDGGGESAVKLTLDRSAPAFKLIFVDDAHLLVATAAGGLRLVRWRTGQTVAESGVNGTIRNVQYEPSKRLLLVERHNNDARVFEMNDDGFGEPHIVADQAFRSGLLAHGIDDHDDAVLWTLDSTNKMRFYSKKALRSDLSKEVIATMGDALPSGQAAPLAIDQEGRRFGVRWSGSRMELFVDSGGEAKTKVAPAGDINQIVVAPDGRRFLAIHQRGSSASITAHDSESLGKLWSYSTGVFTNEVTWSRDSRHVALAATTGAAVLDGETGEVVRRRCGLEFTTVRSAPPTAFNGQQVQSLCE